MSSSRQKVQLTLLCEDKQHAAFAKRYLKFCGFNGIVRPIVAPKGRGSGENFVRKTYAQEVKTYRQKSSHGFGGRAIVVVTDADKNSVQDRLRQLDHELPSKRQSSEKIAIIVARRNIETWIHYIRGTDVDEETSYRKLEKESECQPDVKRLAEQICPQGLPNDAPPSLFTACEELDRIL